MNKVYLIIFLCLSVQACSSFSGDSSAPTVLEDLTNKDEKPSGAASITEFLAILSKIKMLAI